MRLMGSSGRAVGSIEPRENPRGSDQNFRGWGFPRVHGPEYRLTGEADALHDRVYTTFHSGEQEDSGDVSSLITVTTPTHTAVFGPKPHRPELYDRRKNPVQLHNIAPRELALIEQLRADLVAFMEDQGAKADYVNTYAKGL